MCVNFRFLRSFSIVLLTMLVVLSLSDCSDGMTFKFSDLYNQQYANTLDEQGNTPLANAVNSGSVQSVLDEINYGADVNGLSNGSTPLNLAVKSGNLDIVKTLVEHGADANKPDANGDTPLNLAVISGNLDIVKALVEHGADASKPDANGDTALFTAAKNDKNLDILKYLLSKGQNVNQTDTNNHTALYWAITNKNYNTFHYLIDYPGIDLSGMLAYTQTLENADPTNTILSTMEAELQIKLPLVLTVEEFPTTGTRPYYVAFSIKTNQENGVTTRNYYLALKAATGTKPTASQMQSGINYKRNLRNTPIYVYGWGAVDTVYTNPTNINQIRALMLVPQTSYILWGMPNNGKDADVVELKRLSTTNHPISVVDNHLADDSMYTVEYLQPLPAHTSVNGPVFSLAEGEHLILYSDFKITAGGSYPSPSGFSAFYDAPGYNPYAIYCFSLVKNTPVTAGDYAAWFNWHTSEPISVKWTFKATTNY